MIPLPVLSVSTRWGTVDLWHLDHFGIRRRLTTWRPVAIPGFILTGRQWVLEWGAWTLIVAW